MKKYDDLAKIAELRDRGVLSEEEFQQEKSKILQDEGTSFARFFQPPPGEELLFGMKEDTYCMLLHLSQFLIVMIPPFGIAAPILLWFLGKEKSEWVDRHGRVIFNWWISFLIYFVISAILTTVIVGVYLMLALMACAVIFPIICAVKASEGIIWTYPLSFDFFGVKNSSPGKAEKQNTTREQDVNSKEVESPLSTDMHFNADKYQSPSIAEKYR